MWKEYSSSYMKNNRCAGISVRIAAFISALFLSLLCGLFYNAWKYEVERIELDKGAWQSRIVGSYGQEEIEYIKNFAGIKEVVVNKKEAKGEETVIDLYFKDRRMALKESPRIAEIMGIAPEAVIYNHELLAMYFIRDPQDTAPRLLLPIVIFITGMASFALIIILYHSFAVSMNARIHQFGIFSSIGATPKQIRVCLLQEAASLCAVPVMAGNLFGIISSMGLIKTVNDLLGNSVAGRHEAAFGYHPLLLVLTLLVTAVTIWISAWLPAGRLSKVTPLEAIKNTEELRLKHKKNSRLYGFLFGIEGELAGNALKAQRKALRTATLSLFFSFMAFTIMQCFFTISGISTRETYFQRYQGVWDLMITVRNTEIDSFGETDRIQALSGVKSAIVYQKAAAKRRITEAEMSDEMKSLGGFSHASGNSVIQSDHGYLVNAPIVILDDASFLTYCGQIGITPRLDGAVIRNQLRDVTNPDFRHPRYNPYLKEDNAISVLGQPGKEEITVEIPVLSYTDKVPALREEYATLDDYELVHFIPVSYWKEIKEQIASSEEDTYICVLGRETATLEGLHSLQKKIDETVTDRYVLEIENRIQEQEANDRQIQGMMAIFGGFCILLAIIGIGSVFSNALGFMQQRKREFARYMSIGMTPKEIRKMFCIEAMVIAGRPILLTFPIAVIAVGYLLKISYLETGIFLSEAPLVPIVAFLAAILGAVVSAYYLSWRNIRKINLAEVLRDDTMI